ncbi:uncharacterized protein TRIADDRAFT_57642 [Trichoplax adhaerens]|uniref:Integrator complex subunit 11 n=1 Tax=Trichoplax adhaerens TaxID=10228 RepID=B3S010_TRIAD|nr:hypothetical protein TRIADDRAFT_57642 [Trichoplax adhaerens]EDV23926.1 hypothetical protein TRIADDRAFT_57642 [Trichoplax adhaerens]|eukprot:XP_002113452.1 hypothetical protein TRIADDRAFT_57642 [Trichoplax adhaerens]
MPEIKVVPLGAGQDVGRSCILVTIGCKNIMFDCGMHMGYNDDRRFPDFTYITRSGSLTQFLDCVIISHFHLDHCGALPYFSEMCKYDGPIYMTHPTKAICPILLEDYRKITVDRKGEKNFFTSQMIKDCMKKVKAINLHQTVKVDDDLEIKAYYAGHVLGAAMFLVKVGCESVLYTGDYNMTPDRHLGAAWIDKCRPNLLITESTYATTIRDSKRCRERDFLTKVHECVERGGKVLIPVFALGRAQELCILLETYWDRMNLKVPIYFSTGLTEKANHYYKLFITWTNQKIRRTFVQHNMFEFKHIKPFDRALIDNPNPMVVFATPGMLHGGLSLQIFKKWAPDDKNMVILPGYCVAGTVGNKILSGQRTVELENKQIIDVKLAVEYMSFSAHADAKGIMQLIKHAEPENVMLVHGEASKMNFLMQKIEQEIGTPCYMPKNGETVKIRASPKIAVDMSFELYKQNQPQISLKSHIHENKKPRLDVDPRIIEGVIIMDDNSTRLVDSKQALHELGMKSHNLNFCSTISVPDKVVRNELLRELYLHVKSDFPKEEVSQSSDGSIKLHSVVIEYQVNDDSEAVIAISWDYKPMCTLVDTA